MKDFDKLNKQLCSKRINLSQVLTSFALPNSEEIHNMICGYSYSRETSDTQLFEVAESIDYFKYERELCKTQSPKT